MRQSTALSSFLVIMLFLMLSVVHAQEPTIPEITLPDYQALQDALRQEQTTRIIVGLNLDAVTAGVQPKSQSESEERAAIRTAQDTFLNTLIDKSSAMPLLYETIPYLAVTVDRDNIDSLRNSTLVTTIEEDIFMFPLVNESGPLIGADVTQASGLTGAGQWVAVLDTGVDSDHPYLAGQITHEACFSTNTFPYGTNCPNGLDQQIGSGAARACELTGCYHGSHVTGIIAGKNGINGLTGVAPGTKVVAVQVFSKISDLYCYVNPMYCNVPASNLSDMLRGLDYVYQLANDQGLPIAAVNMSLGTTDSFDTTCNGKSVSLENAVNNLREIGVAVIIATGNESYSDGIAFPACLPNVIRVSATDKTDIVADFANVGSLVHVFAPGVEIRSAVPPGTFEDAPDEIYAWASGTSMAAPHVTAAWAVMRQAKPEASIEEILIALQSTGIPITDTRNGLVIPRIQIDAAANVLQSTNLPYYNVLVNEVKLDNTQAVELYNAGASTANLSGWGLQFYSNNALELDYEFPMGLTLESGDYLVVNKGTGTNSPTTLYTGNNTSTWNTSSGGAVRLHNGIVGIDFVRWGNSNIIATGMWSGTNPDKLQVGEVLGRDAQHTDLDQGEDWYAQAPSLGDQNTTPRPPSTDPDDFEGARVITTLPYNDTMDVTDATADVNDPDPWCYQPYTLVGDRINRSVWYRYTAPSDGTVRFETAGTDYATLLSIWTGELGDLTPIACHDDVSGFPLYEDPTSRIDLFAEEGQTYHIMVSAGALLGSTGNQLVFSAYESSLVNDDIKAAQIVEELPYTHTMDVTGSTTAIDDPAPPCYSAGVGNTINNTVWYRYTATRNQTVFFDATGSEYGAIMSVWTGQPGNLTAVPGGCFDSGWTIANTSGPNARVQLNLQSGVTYYIMLSAGGFLGINGNGWVDWNEVLVMNAIDQSPENEPHTLDNPGEQNSSENDQISLQIMAQDPDNDVLTFGVTGLPQGLTLHPTTGLISGRLGYNTEGTHTVTVTAADSGTPANVANVQFTWNIQNANRAPVIEQISDQNNTETESVNLQINASELDYEGLVYAATNLPPGLQINPETGVISGELGYDAQGSYQVNLMVEDNYVSPAQSTKSFNWTVGNVNRAPNVDPIADLTVNEGETVIIPIQAADPDMDTLSYSVNNLPAELSVNTQTGVIGGTLGYTSANTYEVTVTVTDVIANPLNVSTQFVLTILDTESVETTDPVCPVPVATNPLMVPQEIQVNPNQGRPTISWKHDTNMEWINIWIGNSTSTLLMEWYPLDPSDEIRSDVNLAQIKCECGVCTLVPDINPPGGNYEIWMQAWGEDGFSTGGSLPEALAWNRGTDFSIPTSPPGPVLGLSTTVHNNQISFSWQGAERATWYNIWIGSPAPNWEATVFDWVMAEELGCENAETCSLSKETKLLSGGFLPSSFNSGDYIWYVQSWGPGGFSVNGDFAPPLDAWVEGHVITVP